MTVAERAALVSQIVALVGDLDARNRACVLDAVESLSSGLPSQSASAAAERRSRQGTGARVPGRRAEIVRRKLAGESHSWIAEALGLTVLQVNSAVQYARRRGEMPAIDGEVTP